MTVDTSPVPSAEPTTPNQPPPEHTRRPVAHLLRSALTRQETTLAAVILVICLLTSLRNSSFLQSDNLVEILRSSVIYFVMGCGAALLIIGGGLDFSVGAIFTFGALTATKLMTLGVWMPLAILIGLAAGFLLGVINHLVITYLHVPPIIATLGSYFVIVGVDSQMTGGNDVLPLPSSFLALGQGQVLWIPNVIWYGIITGVVFWFALERTRFGVNVRALGGNRQAAIGNGIRVVRLDLVLYAIAGLTGALGGIIYSAQVGAGQVEAGGSSTTLVVVTGVLIGGISILGGLGTMTGVAFGAVLLAVINNALIIASIPPAWNNDVVGAILIAAVAVDHLRRTQLYRKR